MTEASRGSSHHPTGRCGARYRLAALVAGSVPLLTMCMPDDAPRKYGIPAPDANPTEATAAAPSSTSGPDEGESRAYRRVATGEGDGAEPVEPPEFDCRPVAHDERSDDEQYPVPLPPFSPEVFPCTRCHDKPDDFNTTARTLTLDHVDIKLDHGPREQWCYGCHNPGDRDHLRLAGGRLVSFYKSYELCGQCHGEKLRDWRVGIHGRRTGCWNGKREYLLCVHCHSPHSPRFAPLKPKPRPRKPGEIQFRYHAGGQ